MKLNEDIRVLTVHQPWAQCIADGRKDYENRPENVAKFARYHPARAHAGDTRGAGMGYQGTQWRPTTRTGRTMCDMVTSLQSQQSARSC